MSDKKYESWLRTLKTYLPKEKDGKSVLNMPFLENQQTPKNLQIVLDGILNSQVLIITTIEPEKLNVIFHPYSVRLKNERELEVLGFLEHIGKVGSILLSQIARITLPDGIDYRVGSSDESFTSSFSSASNNESAAEVNMRNYWNAFNTYANQEGKVYQVGSRKAYYNQLVTPKFKRNLRFDSNMYFELSYQASGREPGYAQIKIIVEGDDYNELYGNFKDKHLTKAKAIKGFNWAISEGKKRRTIQCAKEKISDSVDVESIPFQKNHFDWFFTKLDLLITVFKDDIQQ